MRLAAFFFALCISCAVALPVKLFRADKFAARAASRNVAQRQIEPPFVAWMGSSSGVVARNDKAASGHSASSVGALTGGGVGSVISSPADISTDTSTSLVLPSSLPAECGLCAPVSEIALAVTHGSSPGSLCDLDHASLVPLIPCLACINDITGGAGVQAEVSALPAALADCTPQSA